MYITLIFLLLIFSARLGKKLFYERVILWFLKLPSSEYKVIFEKDIMIPMEDGIHLASDIYRPLSPKPFPVIIMRTPYGKNSEEHPYKQIGHLFAKVGYVLIVQDVRGKYRSEGEFVPFAHEENDGYQTIEWASQQSFSSQKCAVIGFSYLGCCAWLSSLRKHHAITTTVPMFASQNCHTAWVDNGVPYLKDMLLWLYKHHEQFQKEHKESEMNAILKQLPVIKLDAICEKEIHLYREWLQNVYDKEYWKGISLHHRRDEITIPVLFVGGWFDKFTDQIIEDYLMTCSIAPQDSLVKKSRLLIGPWGHYPMQKFEEFTFGEKSDFFSQYPYFLKWFDTFLKERPYDFDEKNPVEYYMMGKNEWRISSTWPPPEVKEKRYYLESDGGANGASGNGRLEVKVSHKEGKDSYIYDPLDPVFSVGSKMLYGGGYEGPKEQGIITHRHDVLVFCSPHLEEDVMVAGMNKVILYVSSSALDTDFMVKLCDHFPDGRSYFLQSGCQRMSYLKGQKEHLLPNQIYCIELTLGSIAYTFLKGHRIQLQLSSSDFPNHSRNLNTGGDNEREIHTKKALQTLYHGKSLASYLVLGTII